MSRRSFDELVKYALVAVFLVVFLASAIVTLFAFLLQAGAFGKPAVDKIPYLGLLLTAVIVEVAAGVLALWYDLLGLRNAGTPSRSPTTKQEPVSVTGESSRYVINHARQFLKLVNPRMIAALIAAILLPLLLMYLATVCLLALGLITTESATASDRLMAPFRLAATVWLIANFFFSPATLFYYVCAKDDGGSREGNIFVGCTASVILLFLCIIPGALAQKLALYLLGPDSFVFASQPGWSWFVYGFVGVVSSASLGCTLAYVFSTYGGSAAASGALTYAKGVDVLEVLHSRGNELAKSGDLAREHVRPWHDSVTTAVTRIVGNNKNLVTDWRRSYDNVLLTQDQMKEYLSNLRQLIEYFKTQDRIVGIEGESDD